MTSREANIDIARRVVHLAQRAGAEQCDAYLVAYDETEVAVRLGELEKVIEAGSRALGLRVITQGRTAICSTTDFSDDALQRLAADTVELAKISAADEFAGLPDPSTLATGRADGLNLYDESLGSLTTEQKIRMATDCEGAARAFDPRISNSDGASISTRIGEVALANSHGFAASYPSTAVSLMVEVMADDAEGKKRNAYWYSSERSLHRLLPAEEIGRIAARRALDQLGAAKVPTRQAPVVFEPMMAASLLGEFAGAATGGMLYRRATFLADRLGQQVASPLITLVDDPLEPGRRGSRSFDGEGVTARATTLIDAGRFSAFLFDTYAGKRTGNPTTGSAGRGVESLPSPGAANLILRPGATPPAEIVAGVNEGLYVTALMGQGFNPTTGDYSRGAAGFWISGGKLAFPVTEVNISGRLDTMLGAVDAVGDDLTWFGSVASPTVRVAEMTISGT